MNKTTFKFNHRAVVQSMCGFNEIKEERNIKGKSKFERTTAAFLLLHKSFVLYIPCIFCCSIYTTTGLYVQLLQESFFFGNCYLDTAVSSGRSVTCLPISL